jgi:hypothetical protein
MSAQQAWQEASRRWQEHGIANGLRVEPDKLQSYVTQAEEFCRLFPGLTLGDATPPLSTEQAKDPRLVEKREAHELLRGWTTTQGMTNYESFETEAIAMQTSQAMLARKRFYQAEKAVRDAAQYTEAVRLFDEGFDAWKQVLVAHQDCRNRRARDQSSITQRCRDFRDQDRHQEFVYEFNVRYIKLSQDVRQRELRDATLLLSDLVSHGGSGTIGNPFRTACDLYVLAAEVERPDPPRIETRVPQLKAVSPLPLPGPLDSMAPDGSPWISPDIKNRVREKLGLIKRTQLTAPAGGSPPMMPKGGGL